MKKTQLLTVLVITTLAVSIFSVYSLDNTVEAAITTPSVDSASTSKSMLWFSAKTTPLTITTSTANEIVYATVHITNSGNRLTISSTGSLTWHYRGGTNTSYSNGEIASWWAVSSTQQTITITFTSSDTTGGGVASAFCVKNADTTNPFDSGLNNAVSASGTSSKKASSSLTTINPNELIIGVVGIDRSKTITTAEGYTQISYTGSGTLEVGASEYLTTNSIGTYTPSFTFGSSSNWVMIADAFVPISQSITVTSNPLGAGFVNINGTTVTTPYTASYTPGTVLALSANNPVSGGTGIRYTYSNWSDSGSQTHIFTVQSTSATLTANFKTQYQVTFAATGLDSSSTGNILTVNGTTEAYSALPYTVWVNSGDSVIYSYTPTVTSTATGKQYTLSATSLASPLTGITSAKTITASYLIQYYVTFEANPSGSGTINQTSGYFNSGTLIIAATPTDDYLFNQWSSSTSDISFVDPTSAVTTIAIEGTGTVAANFELAIKETVLTLDSNLETIDKGNPLTLSGILTYDGAGLSGKNIVIFYYNGTQWSEVAAALTRSDGTYSYDWIVPVTLPNGEYIIKSDFAGDSQYGAASSTTSGGTLSVNVLPEFELGGAGIIACLVAMMLFVNHNKNRQKQKQA